MCKIYINFEITTQKFVLIFKYFLQSNYSKTQCMKIYFDQMERQQNISWIPVEYNSISIHKNSESIQYIENGKNHMLINSIFISRISLMCE